MKRLLTYILSNFQKRVLGYGKINFKGNGIIGFIDVGSIGDLPKPWFKKSRYINYLLKFEPQESDSLSTNVFSSELALWKETCKRPFYIYKGFNSTGSSLFKQNFDYVNENFEDLKKIGPKNLAETWHERSQLINVTEVECDSLDNIISEILIQARFNFLKIDAQGAEFEILKGAEKFLRTDCLGLHLELFNKPMYEGIKLFDEVVNYLEDLDFILVKKLPPHGSFNSQNDCIFIKNNVENEEKDIVGTILRIYGIK